MPSLLLLLDAPTVGGLLTFMAGGAAAGVLLYLVQRFARRSR